MKPRVMYMHTLDREPASYHNNRYGPHIHFVFATGRRSAILARSYAQLRREQRAVLGNLAHERDGVSRYCGRLGYVRVEIPV